MKKVSYYRLILIKIKWNPWNPWCLGRMNLSWTKYTQTDTYKARMGLEKDYPNRFKDFTYKSFVNNHELEYFILQFTPKDKIKLFFMPFSFGDQFRMPFWKISDKFITNDL